MSFSEKHQQTYAEYVWVGLFVTSLLVTWHTMVGKDRYPSWETPEEAFILRPIPNFKPLFITLSLEMAYEENWEI